MMVSYAPCWEEVGPDVDGLVVHLEAAEDTVQGRAAGVSVPGDDAVLSEHLRTDGSRQVRRCRTLPLLFMTL